MSEAKALAALKELRDRWPFLADPGNEEPVNGGDFLESVAEWFREHAAPVLEPPEIAKMLVLSTAHVTRETAEWLNTETVGYRKGDYGWIIYTDADPDELAPELVACLEFAKAQGCEWIMFDCDADKIDSLETFEW